MTQLSMRFGLTSIDYVPCVSGLARYFNIVAVRFDGKDVSAIFPEVASGGMCNQGESMRLVVKYVADGVVDYIAKHGTPAAA